MAQTTLVGPQNDAQELNTGDSSERGWSPKKIIAAINAMFTELYASVAALDAGTGPNAGRFNAANELYDLAGDGAPDETVGADLAGKGSRYTDVTAGALYINTGTKAAPVWTQLAPVA